VGKKEAQKKYIPTPIPGRLTGDFTEVSATGERRSDALCNLATFPNSKQSPVLEKPCKKTETGKKKKKKTKKQHSGKKKRVASKSKGQRCEERCHLTIEEARTCLVGLGGERSSKKGKSLPIYLEALAGVEGEEIRKRPLIHQNQNEGLSLKGGTSSKKKKKKFENKEEKGQNCPVSG